MNDIPAIVEEKMQEQLWFYEVYYQYYDPDIKQAIWAEWKNAQGGWAYPDKEVSISHDYFDGTDPGWGEVLGEHYVFDETNPDNRLSALAGEATKDDPMKIYYKRW